MLPLKPDLRLIDKSVELTQKFEQLLTSFTVFEIYKNPARSRDTRKAMYHVKQWYKDLFITDLGLWESPVINSTSNSSFNLRRWPYSMSILTGFLPVGVAIVISALFGMELWPGYEEASIQWATIAGLSKYLPVINWKNYYFNDLIFFKGNNWIRIYLLGKSTHNVWYIPLQNEYVVRSWGRFMSWY